MEAGTFLRLARKHTIHPILSFISSLNPYATCDIPVWSIGDKSYKTYNSKDMWNSLRVIKPQVPWFSSVWHKAAIPKHSICYWLFILNRSPTLDRLSSWGLDVESTCLLCGTCIESRDHLFFECSYSSFIWLSVVQRLTVQQPPLSWNLCLNWILPNAAIYLFSSTSGLAGGDL